MKWIALFLFFFASLHAEDFSDAFDLRAEAQNECLEAPPPVFNSMESATFLAQLPTVNVFTGEYTEEACDLVVAGIEPISYRRFYGHQGAKNKAYGHWRINPETHMWFSFDCSKLREKFRKEFAVGDATGSCYSYRSKHRKQPDFNLEHADSLAYSDLTGQRNPLNRKIAYTKHGKDGKAFYYDGTIEDGDGTSRYFLTETRYWPIDNNARTDVLQPPPYQARIIEERRPNGNIIHYDYKDYNPPNRTDPKTPHYFILEKITAYNSTKDKVLGYLTINYKKYPVKNRVREIEIEGSDKRKVICKQELREVRPESEKQFAVYDVVLTNVAAPGKPAASYQYHWKCAKDYFDGAFLCEAGVGNGRLIKTHYDFATKKVISQSAPVGPNGELVPIATYEYHPDHTTVYDAENNKTVYRFGYDGLWDRLSKIDRKAAKRASHDRQIKSRIIAAEKYQKDALYSIERREWDPKTGNLTQVRLEDPAGNVIRSRTCKYDVNHNVIEETNGDYTVYRTFTECFNLVKTEEDGTGKKITYDYKPDTNLLATELIYDHDQLKKRTFHFYNDCAVCTKTIIDDGSAQDPYDLTGVTYRKITLVHPKETHPCFGLPEVIEEKTIDSSGQEILLKKVAYTYTSFGKVEKEYHYDAANVYRYSIQNCYDEKERLVEIIDSLGNATALTYDDNYNLTEIDGPGQHKTITYDAANRPTQLAEWRADGSILLTEKKYDKLSRITSQIDPSGFETRFEYDFLNRLIAIYHPDGSQEAKEYDIAGNLIKETDPNGFETKREYDNRGNPTAIYYPDGTQEHFTYNPKGTLASHTDKNGAQTLYTYDIFDQPLDVKTYSPSGELLKQTQATYTPFCQTSSTDPEGIATYYTYDYAGRKIKEEKAGKQIHYAYDALGRLAKTQTNDALYITEYDTNNQPIEKRTEDLQGNVLVQEKYAYDPMGNQTAVITSKGAFATHYDTTKLPLIKTDPLGYSTTYDYVFTNGFTLIETNPKQIKTITAHDCRGNPIETIKKNTQNETIQKVNRRYDPAGNLLEEIHILYEGTTPFKTITHTWKYGPCNRLESFIEAGQKKTRYLYDAQGRLQTKIKPDGTELHHAYDALGRLSRYYSSDFDYHYTYDKNDQVVSVHDQMTNTITARAYDAQGQLTQETLANGLILQSTYDKHGRRESLKLPKGTIRYTYKADKLYQVTKDSHTHTYLERDLEGNLTKMELPDKLGCIQIERDALSRWTHYTSPYYQAVYDTYDSTGNLCHYQYKDTQGPVECQYAYDELDQLLSEKEHTYRYDSLHNRLKKDTFAYTLNDLCQITGDGKKSYTYDLNGNLLSDGQFHYTYDTQDRLISLKNQKIQIAYTYDPFHRRLTKTEGKKQIKYLFDGDNEIGSSLNGEIKELRILGEGLGAEIGAAVLMELDGKPYIPIHDQRGCLVVLIDLKAKKGKESYRYTAFGEELTKNKVSPWRFASKRVEQETGFIFFGRRYYNPELGRWVTPDPEGFADGPNLYAYLHNGPLLRFDLYGLFSQYSRSYGPKDISSNIQKYSCPKPHRNCSGFENRYSNKSCPYSVNDFGYDYPEMSYGRMLLGNGVGNKFEDVIEKALLISKFSGYNTHGVYNATHGLAVDISEAFMNQFNHALTTPVLLYHQQWDKYFDANPNGPPLWQGCHSQGAPQVRDALELYPKERRDRIIVAAFAPFGYIPPELCMQVTHYVCDSDPVTYFDYKGRQKYKDTIVHIKRDPNIKQSCHEFLNPIYLPYIKDEVKRYHELLQTWDH